MTDAPDLSDLGLESLRHLALLRCPADVHNAIRARIQEIETPYDAVDAAVGLTRGHTSKICAPVPLKGIGLQTLFLMAPELGTALVMVDVGNANLELRKRLLALPQQPIKRRVRMTKAILTAAARRYGAMGKGKAKTFALPLKKRSAIGLANVSKRKWRPVKRHKLGRN